MKETAAIRKRVEKARRLSPQDEAELVAIGDRLSIQPELSKEFKMCRELWAAENCEQVFLAPVEAPFMPKKDEMCCFCEPATWGQFKTSRKRIGYSGFSTSFRIMKGVSYRVGNLKPLCETTEGIKEIASGQLCITNKRLFFDGDRKSTTITYARLLNVEPHSNGLEVTKTSGPNDFFLMSDFAAEYAYMALQEINRQS